MTELSCEFHGRRYRVGSRSHDLSNAVGFGDSQLECFGAPPAREQPLRLGGFVGDVREGGSCNCSTVTITPHCNGTHTEGVGHLTGERLNVRELCRDALVPALVISIIPERASSLAAAVGESVVQPEDLLLTRDAIQSSIQALSRSLDLQIDARLTPALIIRTLPNYQSKRTRHYSQVPAPYFTAEAMRHIVQLGVDHLIVDLPSLDRAEDQGLLTAHRVFWNVPARSTRTDANTRRHATVTELAYIDDEVRDGLYLLNLQIAPLDGDAVPSRPLLMALEPQ